MPTSRPARRQRAPLRARLLAAAVAVASAGSLGACSLPGQGRDTLTIYSGRSSELVGPVLEMVADELDVDVEVRYAGSAELAAQLLEEGERTDADVFFSQDAGALGALASQGRLAELPAEILDLARPEFADPDGYWVGTSGRARVVAYDPGQVAAADLPRSADDLVDPRWRGLVAFAPTNASFQTFVTALRVSRGEDGARAWLEAFAANEPQRYDNNTLVLDAVDRGETALGLINHYYWFQLVDEVGEEQVSARLQYLPPGDPAGLVNVAGAGVLEGSEQSDAAQDAVAFLLGAAAQEFFAEETAEYPVVDGVTSPFDLPPLEDLESGQFDLNQLDSLEQTLVMLDEVGLT